MSRLYDSNHREWQARLQTEKLADTIESRLCLDHINNDNKAFIEGLDMFFLASVDSQGQPTCSYKGGDPGFVRVLDSKTLVFPNFDGNGMFLSVGNLSGQPKVGMLFIDMLSPKRLRLHGSARTEAAEFVQPRYQEAQFVIVVSVTAVFPNCPRYIHTYELVERSPYVPRPDTLTPEPAWKKTEWARAAIDEGTNRE